MDSAFLLDKVYTSVEFHAIFKNILFNNLPFRSLWRYHYQPPPPPKIIKMVYEKTEMEKIFGDSDDDY